MGGHAGGCGGGWGVGKLVGGRRVLWSWRGELHGEGRGGVVCQGAGRMDIAIVVSALEELFMTLEWMYDYVIAITGIYMQAMWL